MADDDPAIANRPLGVLLIAGTYLAVVAAWIYIDFDTPHGSSRCGSAPSASPSFLRRTVARFDVPVVARLGNEAVSAEAHHMTTGDRRAVGKERPVFDHCAVPILDRLAKPDVNGAVLGYDAAHVGAGI